MSTTYPNQTQLTLAEYIGAQPNAWWWGAKGDTKIITVNISAGDTTITSTTPTFSQSDVGKRLVVRGAGGGSDNDTVVRAALSNNPLTDSLTELPLTVIDTAAGASLKIAVNAGGYTGIGDAVYEVWADDNSDFSTEALVHGPVTLGGLESSEGYTVSESPISPRYYRIKARNATTGANTDLWFGAVVIGKVFGSTITSYISPTQVRVQEAPSTNILSAYAYYGTDDTDAIQLAIDTLASFTPDGTADGGCVLDIPRGVYMLSASIYQRTTVIVRGQNGGGSIFMVDTSQFPADSTVWYMTGQPSQQVFFTRLEDVRIDCCHAPGSIGVLWNAGQENSGPRNVTIINWHRKGLQVGWPEHPYGVANALMSDLWIYPGGLAILDDDVVGIDIDYTVDVMLHRSTVLGQFGYMCGYGTAVRIQRSKVGIYKLHTEAAAIGLHWATGAQGFINDLTGHYFVKTATKIETGNNVKLYSVSSNGKNQIEDTSGPTLTSANNYLIGSYEFTPVPSRIRGGGSEAVMEFYRQSPYPSMQFDDKARLRNWSDPALPNILTWDDINFGLDYQGGWLASNSRSAGFPNWEQTSLNHQITALPDSDTLYTAYDTRLSENSPVIVFNDDTPEVPANVPGGLTSDSVYYVKNLAASRKSFQLSATPGGDVIDITSAGTGVNRVTMSRNGGFYKLSPTRFEARFGMAKNGQGTDPGALGLRADAASGVYAPRLHFDESGESMEFGNAAVDRSRWTHGGSGGTNLKHWRSTDSGENWTVMVLYDLASGALYFSGPVYPQYDSALGATNAGDYAGEGSPEGVYAHGKASTYRDRTNGALYVKTTSAASSTGWVNVSDIFWSLLDSDTIGTAYRVNITDATDSRAVGLTVTPTSHVSQAATPLISAGGMQVSSVGRTTVKSLGVNATAPTTDGNVDISGAVNLAARTASRPLKTDSSKNITDGKIDLGVANDIAGTGLSDTQILYWDAGTGTVKSKALAMSDIAGLVSALAGKSDVGHSHTMDNQGAHTHGSAVPSDGGHTHTIT